MNDVITEMASQTNLSAVIDAFEEGWRAGLALSTVGVNLRFERTELILQEAWFDGLAAYCSFEGEELSALVHTHFASLLTNIGLSTNPTNRLMR